MPAPSRVRLLALALSLLVSGESAAGVPPPLESDEPRRYEGEIVVREVEVRFDRSVLPPLESIGRRGEEDFAFFEGGLPYPTVRFDAEGDPAGWTLVVWLDPALAGGEALAAAARELSLRAPALVRAGAVELIAADPEPRPLGRFDAATPLAEALLAAAARLPVGRALPAPAEAGPRIDRLVATLAGRAPEGPRALILPVGGWSIDAAQLGEVHAARLGDAAPDWARAVVDGGRALAAAHWVPLLYGLRRDPSALAGAGPGPQSSTGPRGDTRITYPIFTFPRRRADESVTQSDALETALDFSLAALTQLARPGSGALVGSGRHLESTLGRLLGRARLIVSAPPLEPGRRVRREVRWVGGDGRTLPTPGWASEGASEELAAARLRLRLRGEGTGGGLTALATADEAPLRLCLVAGAARAILRLSRARAAPEGARLVHDEPRTLAREEGESCLEAPALAAGEILLVEDLGRGEWWLP